MRRVRHGLSLLEVLVALTIFLLAFVALGQLIVMGTDRAQDVQPGRTPGAPEEVPGRVAALQPGPVHRGGRLVADQAAIPCGGGGAEEEDDERPFFRSRCSA